MIDFIKYNLKKIIVIILLLTIVYLLYLAWYIFWPYSIKIKNPYKNNIVVGIQLDHDGEKIDVVARSHKEASIRVRRGRYLVRHNKDGYQTSFSGLVVPGDRIIKSPQLLPTAKTEKKILEEEKGDIDSVLKGVLVNGYTVSSEKIFNNGWYGANLKSVDPNKDDLKIILHKTKGRWEIAVSKKVVIYNKKYPEIPKIIISLVNNTLN